MKKLSLLVVGAIIGFAAAYFYLGGTPDDGVPETVDAPRGVITEAEGIALDKAFNAKHRLISDSIMKRPDNRSSWFSLKDVRDYLIYAEAETAKAGYNMDGVRIYLGSYQDGQEGAGYTTMFFVPTGSKAVSEGGLFTATFQGGGDIPGGPGLNNGGNGDPPQGNYPNN